MLRDFVFWTLGVLMAAGVFLLARFFATRRMSSVSPASQRMDEAPIPAAAAKSSPSSNAPTSMISVLDEDGKVLIDVREGLGIPARAQRLPANESAIRHASQLAADLFKGAATLPNRTVEVVFKPEIQQGIRDGAYTLMQTRTGETLADAVDHTGQIVGKGRVVQTGHMQQLAVGAFQLASVAVAQAHLADIERSLQKLSGDLEKVLWAAAGFDDTLLRWKMKPEVVHGEKKDIQPRVQARGGQAGHRAWRGCGPGSQGPGRSRERAAQVGS